MKARPSFRFVTSVVALATSLLFASGCATTNRVALEPARRDQLKATHPVITVSQQEIGVDIERSNITAATGGGLIFALIDSAVDHSRTKKAESIVTALRDGLVDFDFGRGLASALDQELTKLGWLHADPATVQRVADAKAARQLAQAHPADTVLVVETDYRMSAGFAELALTAKVSLYPRSPASTAAADEPLYKNTFFTAWGLPRAVATEPGDRVELWARNNAAPAREVAASAFQDLAALIVYDLPLSADANRAPKDGPKKNVYVVPSPLLRLPLVRGIVEQHRGDRDWVRMPQGELVSSAY